MVNLPHLTNEGAAVGFFWENVEALVSEFGFEVDGVVVQLEDASTSSSAMPDGIGGGESTSSSNPRA